MLGGLLVGLQGGYFQERAADSPSLPTLVGGERWGEEVIKEISFDQNLHLQTYGGTVLCHRLATTPKIPASYGCRFFENTLPVKNF
jgi:hypothetical protein